MAFSYQTGTANHVIHWFALLEAFLVAAGWTVRSGTGTTTIVFSSPGEAGGRTKLFIRFRQDGANAERVWYRVQDDTGGTHFTTENATYNSYLEAPGAGLIPFEYWLSADKDKVIGGFKAGLAYTGSYVGIVEPFALAVDEEEQMVAISLSKGGTYTGYVLKDDDGNWDEIVRSGGLTTSYVKSPLDSSVPLFALRVDHLAYDKIVGQAMDVSARITSLPGINAEDTITTGVTGATSTWIVLGTGTNRWAMRTGGNVPLGSLEGAYFAHTSGLATSMVDFESKLLTFMTAIGWTKVANPSPVWPIDYFWNSAGESGVDNIYIHWYYQTNTRYYMGVSDDTALTHITTPGVLPASGGTPPFLRDSDFPTQYYLTADRDCLLVAIEIAGLFPWIWAGMFKTFLPDPDSIATPYKVGNVARNFVGATDERLLRGHIASAWNTTLGDAPDGFTNSSPNDFDGTTNVIWQFPLWEASSCMIGVAKYLHRLSGPAFSLMDTVAIGARSFRYIDNNLAMREA